MSSSQDAVGVEGKVTQRPRKRTKTQAAKAVAPVFHEGLRPPPWCGPSFKLLTWNVAGMRSLIKKDPQVFQRLVEAEGADVLCVQEHKLQEGHVEGVRQLLGLKGWWQQWSCSTTKKGYSGVAVFSRQPPLSWRSGVGAAAHDGEGRLLTVEFPHCWLVTTYVPNSGSDLKRLDYRVGEWDQALADHVKALEASKPVVLTGDLNVAHQEIDIHDPKGNQRSAGFTQEERESFGSRLLEGLGLVDAFRHQYPGVVGYTYWNNWRNCRGNNKGWRLDYCLVSGSLVGQVHDCFPLSGVMGSDHCPVGLHLKLEGGDT